MKPFQHRVAVVTGGASGIDQALVKAFAGEGMKVVIGRESMEETLVERAHERASGACPIEPEHAGLS